MRFEAILVKSLDLLAAVSYAWRVRHRLTIAREDGRFAVRQANEPPLDGALPSAASPALNHASAIFVLEVDEMPPFTR